MVLWYTQYHSNATILFSKKNAVFVKLGMEEPTQIFVHTAFFFSSLNMYPLIEFDPRVWKWQKERMYVLFESVMLDAACRLIGRPIHNSITQLSAAGSALLNGLFLVDHLSKYRRLTVSSTPTLKHMKRPFLSQNVALTADCTSTSPTISAAFQHRLTVCSVKRLQKMRPRSVFFFFFFLI